MSVTPPKPKDVLAEVAARLSRAAPNTWKEFMEAFSVYSRERNDACVQAAADRVLITQGMARQCIELQTLYNDAAKTK